MNKIDMVKGQLQGFILHIYSINKILDVLRKDVCHVMGDSAESGYEQPFSCYRGKKTTTTTTN